jgi:serine/threonine protein kinase
VDRIGVGGFATVWLYHDDELDSDVAVKALADNWAQRFDIRERFLEEARILRRADSDHVVRVYDIGEADGTPYFVMSYADRGSLGGLLESGRPIDVAQAVDLVEQAGTGLSVLHRQGVIHRDIKPANLLLRSTDDDRVRVLVADLGVAKAMLHASGLTQVVGTPAYMAPEQATGEGIDVRADVHALGAVAYQMLTGRLIREGGIASLMEAQLPAAPSTISTLPRSMDSVLLRAIHPSREERWPDVGSFTRALRASMDSGSTDDRSAPEPTVPRRVVALSEPTQAPTPVPAPVRVRVPVRVPAPEASRAGSRWLLVLLCLLVLAGTFAASYVVTNQLR